MCLLIAPALSVIFNVCSNTGLDALCCTSGKGGDAVARPALRAKAVSCDVHAEAVGCATQGTCSVPAASNAAAVLCERFLLEDPAGPDAQLHWPCCPASGLQAQPPDLALELGAGCTALAADTASSEASDPAGCHKVSTQPCTSCYPVGS